MLFYFDTSFGTYPCSDSFSPRRSPFSFPVCAPPPPLSLSKVSLQSWSLRRTFGYLPPPTFSSDHMHPLSSREDGSSGQVVFTESNTAKLLAVETVLISMVIAVVGLRCWCRHYMLRAFQLDDACMIAALVCISSTYLHLLNIHTVPRSRERNKGKKKKMLIIYHHIRPWQSPGTPASSPSRSGAVASTTPRFPTAGTSSSTTGASSSRPLTTRASAWSRSRLRFSSNASSRAGA